LNEGLAQDKIELNKIILLVEQEKNSICNEKSDVEQDKSTLRQVCFHTKANPRSDFSLSFLLRN